MIGKPISTSWRVGIGIFSVLTLLLSYTYLAHRQHQKPGHENDTTVPTWSQMSDGFELATESHKRTGERWLVEDGKATFERLTYGLFWGISIAFVLGILMGCFPKIESFFGPLLTGFDKIPPTAMLSVFFVLFGIAMKMYVAMIVFGIAPPLARTVFESVRKVPDELINKAYTLGASTTEVIWNVIVRQIMPKFIYAIRVQFGMAMILLIAAEMVVSDVGFGYRIRLMQRSSSMDVIIPYLLCLMAFGFLVDTALAQLQKRLYPWYEEGGR